MDENVPRFDPHHLTKDQVVSVLTRSGSRTMTMERLEADLASGAPLNEDGTVDIVAYAAWILKGKLNGD